MPYEEPSEEEMEFVEASELPAGKTKITKWELMFGKIPEGKAWVIPEGKYSFHGIRCSLYSLQDHGKFKNLKARKIREADGTYKMYIINNPDASNKEKTTNTKK
jgi:hypothetical protein